MYTRVQMHTAVDNTYALKIKLHIYNLLHSSSKLIFDIFHSMCNFYCTLKHSHK